MTPRGINVRSRVQALQGGIEGNPDEANDPNELNAMSVPHEEDQVPYFNSSEDQATDSEGHDGEDYERESPSEPEEQVSVDAGESESLVVNEEGDEEE